MSSGGSYRHLPIHTSYLKKLTVFKLKKILERIKNDETEEAMMVKRIIKKIIYEKMKIINYPI